MNIILSHIIKEFRSKHETTFVLKDISCSFANGMSYAITGRSGCGKSTLLHIIAGFEQPTSGTILPAQILGVIGILFQAPYLLAELSVLENIMIAAKFKGLATHEAQTKARHLLEKLELYHKRNELPAFLSGGQQQRVAFARAIITEPRFLLADEPTSNLDDDTAQIIITLLKEYQLEKQCGLIVSSHDTAIVTQMDYIFQLSDGRLGKQEPKL